MSSRIRLALVAMCVALPLAAQKTPVKAPPKQQAAAAQAKPGFALDFQDQDIRVVLTALAEAGGINLNFNNLPPTKVTLRMGQTADKTEIASMIKAIAEANNMKVTQTGNLMQVAGPPVVPAGPTVQQLAQQQQATQLEFKLYTYRLKHSSATQLAPLLTALFAGAQIGRTTQASNTNNQGFGGLQGGNGRGVGGGAAGGGGGGGGRGAGGGAAVQGLTVTTQAAPGGAAGNPNQLLQQIFGGGATPNTAADVRIVGEETSNTLMVRATVADWALIQQVIQGVDTRPLQVLIEVTIAEVARTSDLNVGISGVGANKSGSKTDSASFPSAASARDFILKLTQGNGAINYNVALNALQSRGDVKVLSLPVVIAQNNKQAILNVGSRVPFVSVSQNVTTGTTPTTVQTVQYLDVGTVLTITPTINSDGYVNMAVVQTDNSVTTTPQFSNPVINTREATTQVFLRDGQTTVIGGLAGKTTNKTTEGIPILSKIPFIGKWLFAHTTESNSTSELFLFLTPHVIYTDTDIDQLRNAVNSNTDLLKQVPTGARFSPAGDTIHVGVTDTTSKKKPDSTGTGRGGRGGGGGR